MPPVVAVPFHLDERLPGLDLGVPAQVVDVPLPPGDPWSRMSVLYDEVAEVVAAQPRPPVVVSGDCTTSLGVLAGLQRAGSDGLGVVWLDAHADFHTEQSTTSGYLGGLPLALAVGVGTLTLPRALGLRPLAEDRAVLVDARDTDPGEADLLSRSAVRRSSVRGLVEVLPDGPLYLHVDVDVCDPSGVPGLLYPVPGGPAVEQVLAALRAVVATGRVVATGLAATWRQGGEDRDAHERLVAALLAACS